jgi:Ser/Thr protein kinase RdoA (MazF antagonist)
MNSLAATLDPEETRAVLSAALNEVHGADVRLAGWIADDHFTGHGKRRVVRYDLEAQVAGVPNIQRYRWLGKFYDSDEEARRVAAVLQDLAALGGRHSNGLEVPSVLLYHAPSRLLLLTYESGEPVSSAIAWDTESVLAAMGRALAALHAMPITTTALIEPVDILDNLRPKLENLCARFPSEAAFLRSEFNALEREAAQLPAVPCLVHGDFGPANLLWRSGHIVILDWDNCGRGDPALDLGNLLTQLLRMTVRKPHRLRDFASARAGVLDAYQRSSPPDPTLERRIAWYERAILLRKIHHLAFNTKRGPESRRQRQDEVNHLLKLISLRQTPGPRAEPSEAVRAPGVRAESALVQKRRHLVAAAPEGFPADPDFPQLPIATDPKLMLDVFRKHLKPVKGKAYVIEDCLPFRFRCRQSDSRCVLQYTLRVADPSTGRRWDQWVTGLLYANDGEAERLWKEAQLEARAERIPEDWLTFEPSCFIPDLEMFVQVFPFDRRLPNLCAVMGGALSRLEPPLLARLGPGEWHVEDRAIEPTRYRTELGGALRYTVHGRDALSGIRETVRCHVKVYRNKRGADTAQILRAISSRASDGHEPYSVVRPVAYLDDLRTLALEEAPGRSVTWILSQGQEPIDVLGRVARAVAAFNQDDFPVPRRESLADQLEDVRNASTLVQWACPAKRESVQAMTETITQGLDSVLPAPIHGDLKPDHVFVSGDRVIFIDVDNVTLGDPVRDPAHMYSYLIGGVGLGSTPPERIRAAAAEFVEEYFRHVPTSWRRQFPLHCAGALIEVASGIFRRQEPGWRDKIAGVVEAAQHAISEGAG